MIALAALAALAAPSAALAQVPGESPEPIPQGPLWALARHLSQCCAWCRQRGEAVNAIIHARLLMPARLAPRRPAGAD